MNISRCGNAKFTSIIVPRDLLTGEMSCTRFGIQRRSSRTLLYDVRTLNPVLRDGSTAKIPAGIRSLWWCSIGFYGESGVRSGAANLFHLSFPVDAEITVVGFLHLLGYNGKAFGLIVAFRWI